MKEIKKEIEVEASLEKVYDVFLHYPSLNPYGVDSFIWKDASCWKEVRENEVERVCKMLTDKEEHSVIIYVYNSENKQEYHEKIVLKAKEINENKTCIEVYSMAGEHLSSRIGYHIRRYSIEVWMEKLMDKIEGKVKGG